jgi:hypothetical protein
MLGASPTEQQSGQFGRREKVKMKTWLTAGTVISLAAVSAVFAGTFRTPAALQSVTQDTQDGNPAYNFQGYAGHDLVNWALGTPVSTVRTNEVLAMTVDCTGSNSSSIALVVWDKVASSNIATIATSSRIATVLDQGKNDTNTFPSHERFVTLLDVATLGNGSNGLIGGYLTMAGRIQLSPTNGCPRAVLVDTDRRDDKNCGDPKEIKDTDEKGSFKPRAGRAHFIGVLDVISVGETNTLLVPAGALTLLRELAP